jgi:membrane protein YdbS with pleckstrin-like domain
MLRRYNGARPFDGRIGTMRNNPGRSKLNVAPGERVPLQAVATVLMFLLFAFAILVAMVSAPGLAPLWAVVISAALCVLLVLIAVCVRITVDSWRRRDEVVHGVIPPEH